jgi:hypothetical protein
MLARRAQICVLVRSCATISLETKAEVLPGVKCVGKIIADWDDILVDYFDGQMLVFWRSDGAGLELCTVA